MKFETRGAGEDALEVHSSGSGSRLELVFIPGPFNPGLWENQLRYFSNSFSCTTYRAAGGYEKERDALETVLSEVENAVLVSYGPGNSLAQYFEERDSVVSTVITGPCRSYAISERGYRLALKASTAKPKLGKKLFFDSSTEYACVKQFFSDLEAPEYKDFSSYTSGYGLREPLKDALFIVPKRDRFSSLEYAREIRASAELSVIDSSSSFPFYSRPEEYNKAVFDFLTSVESFLERRELRETREENRTLDEYSQEKQRERVVYTE